MSPNARYVDEVEVQWRALVQDLPLDATLEVNYNNTLDARHLEAISNLTGISYQVTPMVKTTRNKHTSSTEQEEDYDLDTLHAQDLEYRSFLPPSPLNEYFAWLDAQRALAESRGRGRRPHY